MYYNYTIRMNDIFPYLCKHVIKCPTLNLDVSNFVFQPEVLNNSRISSIFITDYLLPLMHAIEREESLPSETKRSITCLKFFVLKVAVETQSVWQGSIRITDRYAEKVMQVFEICQRRYHSMCRFVRICRERYAKTKNEQDLHLANIQEGDPGTYILMHQSAKYVFRVNELRDTIMSCITNTDEFFPDILVVRNPYNNIPLTLCELYNFYFFLKTRNYGIPVLLHGFFMSNFNTPKYIMDYEILIRDKAIHDRVMGGSTKLLYPTVFRMLLRYRKCIRSIQIAKGFPMKTLVEVMRPYLLLYFYVMHYAQDFPKRFESEQLLENRLSEFDYVSPNFGKRTRSTHLLHITHVSPNMDETAFRNLFEKFGEIEIIFIPASVENNTRSSGYVIFADLDCADRAFHSLQSFCYYGVESEDVIQIDKIDKLPDKNNIRIEDLSPPRVQYNASHPVFHRMKSLTVSTTDDIITFTDQEDVLFNRIEEHGTVDAWDESNNENECDDGMYVGQYYSTMSNMKYKHARCCNRPMRAMSESSTSISECDDCSVSDEESSMEMDTTSQTDIDIDNDVMTASAIMSRILETQEEIRTTSTASRDQNHEEEEVCDTLTHEIAVLSMSGLRTERHLQLAETIYERLNNMTCDHDVAIRQIDEEFNMITNGDESDSDSDSDSDDEPNDEL